MESGQVVLGYGRDPRVRPARRLAAPAGVPVVRARRRGDAGAAARRSRRRVGARHRRAPKPAVARAPPTRACSPRAACYPRCAASAATTTASCSDMAAASSGFPEATRGYDFMFPLFLVGYGVDVERSAGSSIAFPSSSNGRRTTRCTSTYGRRSATPRPSIRRRRDTCRRRVATGCCRTRTASCSTGPRRCSTARCRRHWRASPDARRHRRRPALVSQPRSTPWCASTRPCCTRELGRRAGRARAEAATAERASRRASDATTSRASARR